MTLLPKFSIDMAVQSQALSVLSLTSYLCILKCVRDKHPFTSYFAAKHPKHSKFAITTCKQNPHTFFIVRHSRRFFFTSAIIL